MALSKEEIEQLLRLVGSTDENEINCEQCLALAAEMAERELGGGSIRDGLKVVVQHLAICGECQEEYEALQLALESEAAGGDE